MTTAASSVGRTRVVPARTTIMPTTSTPSRSIATTRSGSDGPLISRPSAASTASPRMARVISEIVSNIVTPRLLEHALDAALETFLDFSTRLLGAGHVHHVHVE